MSLLDSYQDSTDQALSVMAKQPLTPESPKPKHSGWTTVPRAVAGAVAELSGNALDVSGALAQTTNFPGGEMLDFSGGEMGNMSASQPDQQSGPYTKKNRVDQFKKLNTEGFDFRSGKPAYQFAQDLRPDPLTAGTAENIVFGLTKGLTKAIGAGVVLGPMAGAGVFGTSEGMTAAEDLANQGVDKSTRTKVGAVTGVLNAVGVALPVVGKNLAQTAALVAVGGPGSFIAQQSASKAILQNANYDEIAAQYDPLDPVGLAVSTLVPAGFATWARGTKTKQAAKALRFNDPALDAHATTVEQQHGLPAGLLVAIKNAGERSNSNQESVILDKNGKRLPGAKGVMQFIPSTWKQYGKGDITNPADSIDAAGRYFADLIKRYDGNVDAAITEYNGGVKQARAVAEGKTPTAKETIAYLGRVKQALEQPAKAEATPEIVVPKPTQEHIDAAMVQNLTVARDVYEAAGVPDVAPLVAEVPPIARDISSVVADIEAKYPDIKLDAGEGKGPIIVSRIVFPKEQRGQGFGTDAMRTIVEYADANGKQIALTPSKDFGGTVTRLKTFYKNLGFVENKGKNRDLSISETMVRNPETPSSAEALPRVYGGKPASWVIRNKKTGEVVMETFDKAKVDALNTSKYEAVSIMEHLQGLNDKAGAIKTTTTKARAKTTNPDLPVAVKDDGTHTTAAEQLDAIKQQAQEGTDTELGALDAPLLKVAAECLLS